LEIKRKETRSNVVT